MSLKSGEYTRTFLGYISARCPYCSGEEQQVFVGDKINEDTYYICEHCGKKIYILRDLREVGGDSQGIPQPKSGSGLTDWVRHPLNKNGSLENKEYIDIINKISSLEEQLKSGSEEQGIVDEGSGKTVADDLMFGGGSKEKDKKTEGIIEQVRDIERRRVDPFGMPLSNIPKKPKSRLVVNMGGGVVSKSSKKLSERYEEFIKKIDNSRNSQELAEVMSRLTEEIGRYIKDRKFDDSDKRVEEMLNKFADEKQSYFKNIETERYWKEKEKVEQDAANFFRRGAPYQQAVIPDKCPKCGNKISIHKYKKIPWCYTCGKSLRDIQKELSQPTPQKPVNDLIFGDGGEKEDKKDEGLIDPLGRDQKGNITWDEKKYKEEWRKRQKINTEKTKIPWIPLLQFFAFLLGIYLLLLTPYWIFGLPLVIAGILLLVGVQSEREGLRELFHWFLTDKTGHVWGMILVVGIGTLIIGFSLGDWWIASIPLVVMGTYHIAGRDVVGKGHFIEYTIGLSGVTIILYYFFRSMPYIATIPVIIVFVFRIFGDKLKKHGVESEHLTELIMTIAGIILFIGGIQYAASYLDITFSWVQLAGFGLFNTVVLIVLWSMEENDGNAKLVRAQTDEAEKAAEYYERMIEEQNRPDEKLEKWKKGAEEAAKAEKEAKEAEKEAKEAEKEAKEAKED